MSEFNEEQSGGLDRQPFDIQTIRSELFQECKGRYKTNPKGLPGIHSNVQFLNDEDLNSTDSNLLTVTSYDSPSFTGNKFNDNPVTNYERTYWQYTGEPILRSKSKTETTHFAPVARMRIFSREQFGQDYSIQQIINPGNADASILGGNNSIEYYSSKYDSQLHVRYLFPDVDPLSDKKLEGPPDSRVIATYDTDGSIKHLVVGYNNKETRGSHDSKDIFGFKREPRPNQTLSLSVEKIATLKDWAKDSPDFLGIDEEGSYRFKLQAIGEVKIRDDQDGIIAIVEAEGHALGLHCPKQIDRQEITNRFFSDEEPVSETEVDEAINSKKAELEKEGLSANELKTKVKEYGSTVPIVRKTLLAHPGIPRSQFDQYSKGTGTILDLDKWRAIPIVDAIGVRIILGRAA